MQGFYLKSATQCLPVAVITKCATYDPSASTPQCTECSAGFYVSSNQCQQRQNGLIPNCFAYSPNADKCSQCQQQYMTTSDGLGCLRLIQNCLTYTPVASPNTKNTCQSCNPGLYLDSTASSDYATNSCITVTNACKTYVSGDKNKCVNCLNQFYLDAATTTCKAQLYMPTCLQYDDVKQNVCRLCVSP